MRTRPATVRQGPVRRRGRLPKPDDGQRQVYAENIISMMADHNQSNAPATETGARFRDVVDNATFAAFEDHLHAYIALGDERNTNGQSGPDAYQSMRDEIRDAATIFRSVQDQPEAHGAFDPDDYNSAQISTLTGDPTLYQQAIAGIEDAGVQKVAYHLITQADKYSGSYDDAAEQIWALDRIMSSYDQPTDGNDKSPAQMWSESLAEIGQMDSDDEIAESVRQEQVGHGSLPGGDFRIGRRAVSSVAHSLPTARVPMTARLRHVSRPTRRNERPAPVGQAHGPLATPGSPDSARTG